MSESLNKIEDYQKFLGILAEKIKLELDGDIKLYHSENIYFMNIEHLVEVLEQLSDPLSELNLPTVVEEFRADLAAESTFHDDISYFISTTFAPQVMSVIGMTTLAEPLKHLGVDEYESLLSELVQAKLKQSFEAVT
jgi:hypothetical protein